MFTFSVYHPAICYGGPVVSTHELARNLVLLGHDVHVYTTNANGDQTLDVPIDTPVDIDGVKVHYYRRDKNQIPWPLSKLSYFSKTVSLTRSRDQVKAIEQDIASFDVVHTHSPLSLSNGRISKAAKKTGVPHFFHARGMLQATHLQHKKLKKILYLNLMGKKAFKRAAGLFALTEDEMQGFRDIGLNNPVYIVPNGIDPGKYLTEVSDPDIPIIKKLETKRVILFLSRIYQTKGLDLLVPAFCKLASKYSDTELVIAGPDEGELVPEIKKFLLAANLSDRVHFPGIVSGNLKFNLIARADIFTLPSYMEGFSMCILEAMVSKKPVLVTHACHFPDISRYQAGIVVDENIDAYTDGLDKLLSDPDKTKQMGINSRQLVMDKFQWPQLAIKTIDAYQQALK